MKVLVVDGVPRDRQAIVDALSQLDNVKVHDAVGDISSALRALVVGRPAIDVVVTGVALIGGDCFELIEATRRWEPPPSIVVVGQDSSRDDWRRHLVAGADRFVERDPDLRELRDVVSDLASRSNSTDDPLRLLGRMTAGVLHDLNNYLNVIGVALQLGDRAPSAMLREELGLALDHASALTKTVLEHMRGETSDLAPVDLAAIVQDATRIATRTIDPGIVVVLLGVESIKLVRGVTPRLGQLVLNLVLNAADAMESGGILTVNVRTTPVGAICLDVSDTGPGLAGDAAQSSSAWSRSTKPGRGASGGLGLGIVRAVVQQHHASFTLSSGEEGGTVATVVFPKLEDPTAAR